tara:strand:- start:571 stop:876 length:306 start_codon:yes stop_codon:yes gene_type:complete
MKKAYLVAMPTIKDSDTFAKNYATKVADTLKPFEGKFLVRTPDKLVKEGDEKSLTVVIEFPNKEKALGWYNSSEHQKIVVHRRATTDPSSPIVICEESDTY